jgi:phosphoglycolate phosphatase-like HAD superfamily hydrolase
VGHPFLFLFDIDGTLLHTSGAGIRGMNAAFVRLHGRQGALDGVPIAGRTDRAIVSDAMRKIGVEPTDRAIAELRDAYMNELPEEIRRHVPGNPSRVLPGVAALLEALEAEQDAVIALLTGNFQSGARIKLGHFGLWERFAFGAFGDDDTDRRALVPIARRRAVDAGHPLVPPDRIVIVGDTPHDVDCAKAHGAVAVGVATGPFDAAALHAAGADVVVETLEEREDVLAVIRQKA